MTKHRLTGFGFGPIQAGLFVNEAYQSGNFERIVVAEIDRQLVDAVRDNNGKYFVNVAKSDGIEVLEIENVEMLNPNAESQRKLLVEALCQATEIVTSLPSVNFYDMEQKSIASLIAKGLADTQTDAKLIYTAENNNQAAEILKEKLSEHVPQDCLKRVQFLNTVIGKMSQVVTDSRQIEQMNLVPIAPEIERAFLVEEFNRILVTKCELTGFMPGIEVFIEKQDLLPFEEAKLYGHNAIHALLAYLGAVKGYKKMSQLKEDADIITIGRDAFLTESGAALIKKYAVLGDGLFTEAGYKAYAEDLLTRMTNPYLADTIERAGRDLLRKLGAADRIFGTMILALEQGIEPVNIAVGAVAAIATLLDKTQRYKLPEKLHVENWCTISEQQIEKILNWIWSSESVKYSDKIIKYVFEARQRLIDLVK